MTYQQKLNPWIVIRLQPNLKNITVGRFRRRNDAEGHLRILKQMIPQAKFAIAFDCGDDTAESVAGVGADCCIKRLY